MNKFRFERNVIAHPCCILSIIFLFSYKIHAQTSNKLTRNDSIAIASGLVGLHFTLAEIDSMGDNIEHLVSQFEELREESLENQVIPALGFNPMVPGMKFDKMQNPITWEYNKNLKKPENEVDLAYMSLLDLASLLRNKEVTSQYLTSFFISRLKTLGDTLACVVTLLEQRAINAAKKADEEMQAGHFKGPLHGIPFGVKDLLSLEGYPTTWGAMPYKEQKFSETATVINRLEASGAILIAKLSMGALAWGDVWFEGRTLNPWNLLQGSSGSSAGSAAATSAGLVPFSIGTETLGSIVSPSTRCGVTGLRPSYGRVSRHGAMALSWSMDKIGAICRSVEDCAIVFQVIHGPDNLDSSLYDVPFNYSGNLDLSNLKVGYLKSLFERDYGNKENDRLSLEVIKNSGAALVPINLPDDLPIQPLIIILNAESAAAFEQLTLSNQDSMLVRQIKNAWPNVFRSSHLIPAITYIQANRLRTLLQRKVYDLFKDFDVIISPSFGGDQLLITNLTGYPCVVVPNGFNQEGSPTSLSFIGNLFDEATVLGAAKIYQEATDFHLKRPPLFAQ